MLIYPTFCLLQVILTKEIIGCGTKRWELYYMEDFNVGHVTTYRVMGGKDKSSFGIDVWGTRVLAIRNIYYLIFFPI